VRSAKPSLAFAVRFSCSVCSVGDAVIWVSFYVKRVAGYIARLFGCLHLLMDDRGGLRSHLSFGVFFEPGLNDVAMAFARSAVNPSRTRQTGQPQDDAEGDEDSEIHLWSPSVSFIWSA
jgi:hypothetical protein